MKSQAMLLCDFYKIGHRLQYPKNTEIVYSTWIPRSNKHMKIVDKVVAYGFQGFVKEFLIDFFNREFFEKDIESILLEYKRIIKFTLGVESPETEHIEELWKLGYLPVKIMAVDEGLKVPIRTAMLTIENTDKRFYWITNYLETLMSSLLWKPSTTATIACEYYKILSKYAIETTGSSEGVKFQGHDFSMRGMSGIEDAARSGSGHLVSGFVGTDTIPSINYVEEYYNGNVESELIGCSVNATEHSVMCANGKDNEIETYRRLIEDIYPTGILSIVSDTWDLWYVLNNIIPSLKLQILSRDGGDNSIDKVVIRPDSGDPADIICGNPESQIESERKGVIRILWDIFGGTVTDNGYKLLHPCIGAIYGDSITLEKCEEICNRLKSNGFASTNIVLGIGSYTYQYLTRDSLGFAMKATSVTINGERKAIFKDPVTDDGVKKSAYGRVAVIESDNKISMIDESDNFEISECGKFIITDKVKYKNLLKPLFIDGVLMRETSISEIRSRLDKV